MSQNYLSQFRLFLMMCKIIFGGGLK